MLYFKHELQFIEHQNRRHVAHVSFYCSCNECDTAIFVVLGCFTLKSETNSFSGHFALSLKPKSSLSTSLQTSANSVCVWHITDLKYSKKWWDREMVLASQSPPAAYCPKIQRGLSLWPNTRILTWKLKNIFPKRRTVTQMWSHISGHHKYIWYKMKELCSF